MQKLISVARVERQVRDLPRVHHRAELRAGGVNERRFGSHFDRLFRLADLQYRIDRHHLVEIDVHFALHVFLETREIEIHVIGANRNLREAVFAVARWWWSRCSRPCFVRERDLHVASTAPLESETRPRMRPPVP